MKTSLVCWPVGVSFPLAMVKLEVRGSGTPMQSGREGAGLVCAGVWSGVIFVNGWVMGMCGS